MPAERPLLCSTTIKQTQFFAVHRPSAAKVVPVPAASMQYPIMVYKGASVRILTVAAYHCATAVFSFHDAGMRPLNSLLVSHHSHHLHLNE